MSETPNKQYAGDISQDLYDKAWHEDPFVVIPMALNDANDIRRALAIGEGKLAELPAANVGESEDCVLARALSNGWRAVISTVDATITHPRERLSWEEFTKAVKALEALGFVGVDAFPYVEPGPHDQFHYIVKIPHTWAMATFVSMYDAGAFPSLILEEDEDGREKAQIFQAKRETGGLESAWRNDDDGY